MLSKRQREAARHCVRDGLLSLSVGTVRSGKTFGAMLAFSAYTLSLSEPYKHLLLGRKLRVIESELLPHLRNLSDALGFRYSYVRNEQIVRVGTQKYHLVAGNDERSADRVTGLTCHSALIDEATLVPESFFDMSLGRLTFDKSKAWATCNPGHPLHWLKRKWIDQDRVDQYLEWSFNDNPSLSQEVIERYNTMFSGVFAKRMVEGLWAAAEGLVYPNVTLGKPEKGYRLTGCVLGVDYGITNPTAIVPLERWSKGNEHMYYVPRVRRVQGTDEVYLTDSAIGSAVAEEARRHNAPVVLDPSATSLRNELLQMPGRDFLVRRGKNDVLPGIRVTGNLLDKGQLIIDPEAQDIIDELQSYAWDVKKPDTPAKEHDHFLDGLRYAAMDLCRITATNSIRLPKGL